MCPLVKNTWQLILTIKRFFVTGYMYVFGIFIVVIYIQSMFVSLD